MYLCIDIGATKTLLALFSEGGRRLRYLEFPTQARPRAFADDLALYLDELLPIPSQFTVQRVVVAVPATVKNGEPHKYGNLAWADFPITTAISVCIKNLFKRHLPISYLNDADAATLYEVTQLPDDAGLTLYLTLSTGIGGGLAQDGELLPASATFEPGHRKYTFEKRRQEWEDFASAAAVRSAHRGRKVTFLFKKPDLDDIATRIAIGLSPLIRQRHPDHVILGGPLGAIFPRYQDQLLRQLHLNLKTDHLPTITRARRPHESTIYGCYRYAAALQEATQEATH